MIKVEIKKLLCISVLLVSFCIFGISNDVSSQAMGNYGPQISVNPSNPSYGQTVTASIDSTSVNLDSSVIVWQVNGITKKQGEGEKSFSFQTDKSGNVSLIKVNVTDQQGNTYEDIYEVAPSEVDLIIEPGTLVPPFYMGRSAFVPQGTTKIIAMTNILSGGRKVSNNNLSFKWKKNGVVLSDASGKGKDTFEVSGSVPIKNIEVDLEVYDAKSNLVGRKSTTITPFNTNVVLYQNSALYGKLFNNALVGTRNISSLEEISIVAYPLFFNINNAITNEITYKWYVDSKRVATEGAVNSLLLRQTGGKGSASINLKIEGVTRIFQYGSNGFNLMFGE